MMWILSKLSHASRILVIGVGLPVVLMLILATAYYQNARKVAVENLVSRARALNLTAESVRVHAESLWENGTFETSQLRKLSESGHADHVLATVPIITAMNSLKNNAEKAGYQFHVSALSARNPAHNATDEQMVALRTFLSSSHEEFVKVDEIDNDVHFYRPVRLTSMCLNCHGDPKSSEKLWGNTDGRDITGFKMEDLKEGDLYGLFEIEQSLDSANAEAKAALTKMGGFLFVGLLVCGALSMMILKSIRGDIGSRAETLQNVAQTDLANVSRQMRQNAQETTHQATLASGAAEQVSTNAQALATAVEQFNSSIKEISGNTSHAATVAGEAVAAANRTTATVTKLGESSAEIGNVIKVINSIAEQTNLLALNATIEAARAGEAGKGFAVVANEVKELAKQTSGATEDIIRKIAMIQEDTHQAVEAITQVSGIIRQINESQNAIASAVEEQSAMTGEISRNISEVAAGSSEIARNITMVAEAAESTSKGTDETLRAANDIEAMAEQMLTLVGQVQQVASGRPYSDYHEPTNRPTLSQEPVGRAGVRSEKMVEFN